MSTKDMRTWIAQLQAAGELIRIDKPVDPLTQMGSLLYQSREKALLFEKLPHGWRSLGQAPANLRHAALAFGATEETLIPLVAAKLGAVIPPAMMATVSTTSNLAFIEPSSTSQWGYSAERRAMSTARHRFRVPGSHLTPP